MDIETDLRFEVKQVKKIVNNKKYLYIIVSILLTLSGFLSLFFINKRINLSKKAFSDKQQEFIVPIENANSYCIKYSVFKDYFPSLADIYAKGSKGIIAEFDDRKPRERSKYVPSIYPGSVFKEDKIYAGHLGSFWQYPYYSSPANFNNDIDNNYNYKDAFVHGLGFFNRNNNLAFYEQAETDLNKGTWCPSKLIVESAYVSDTTKGIPAFSIKGEKVSSPMGYSGFSLKLTITNNGSEPLNLNILSYSALNFLDRGNRVNYGGNCSQTDTTLCAKGKTIYDGITKSMVYNIPNFTAPADNPGFPPPYLAMGGTLDIDSYHVQGKGETGIFAYFKNHGLLDKQITNLEKNGNEVGIVYKIPEIGTGQSLSFTLAWVFGTTQTNSAANLRNIISSDHVAYSDNYWTNLINVANINFPQVITKNETIDKIYKKSLITYLMNVFEFNKPVYKSDGTSFVLSPAYPVQFIWEDHIPLSISYLGLTPDETGNKPLIKKFIENGLKLNLRKQNYYSVAWGSATDPLNSWQNGTKHYLYDPYSLIKTIYYYVNSSGDYSYLDQAIVGKVFSDGSFVKSLREWLKYLLLVWEDCKQWNENTCINSVPNLGSLFHLDPSLVDFMGDNNLYEFNTYHVCPVSSNDGDLWRPPCATNLSDKYIHFVPTPNYERAIAFQMVAEIGELSQNEKYLYNNHANSIFNRIKSQLWNNDEKWFDLLWYSGGQTPDAAVKRYFPIEAIFHIAETVDGADDYRYLKMKEKLMDEFLGPNGFYSLPKLSNDPANPKKFWDGNTNLQWAAREDWQGPGLYTGEVATTLNVLFKRGSQEDAYNIIMNKYGYLSDFPYHSQCLNGDIKGSLGYMFSRTGCGGMPYMEGLGFSDMILRGMFGIEPKMGYFEIFPRMPVDLFKDGNEPRVNNIKIQGITYNILVSVAGNSLIQKISENKYLVTVPNNTLFSSKDVITTPTNTPATIPTVIPTVTITPIRTPTPVSTFTPTPTRILTATPTSTRIPTLTNTPTPIATHTPVPTNIPTQTPSFTPIPTNTPFNSPTPSLTPSPTLIPIISVTVSGYVKNLTGRGVASARVYVNKVIGGAGGDCSGQQFGCGYATTNYDGFWTLTCEVEQDKTCLRLQEENPSGKQDCGKDAQPGLPGGESWGRNTIAIKRKFFPTISNTTFFDCQPN